VDHGIGQFEGLSPNESPATAGEFMAAQVMPTHRASTFLSSAWPGAELPLSEALIRLSTNSAGTD